MIEGTVNAHYEAVIALLLLGPAGRVREIIEADGMGVVPLVGMALLDGHNLNIAVADGGRVVIEAMA